MSTEPVRVLIADDHAVLREGLTALLNAQPEFEVVGEACNGRQAIAEAARLKPDVVVLDITMPELGGIEALPQIQAASPESRILVLSMHDDPTYLRAVLAAGASGFVAKQSAGKQLLTGLKEVLEGRAYINVNLHANGLKSVVEGDEKPRQVEVDRSLTKRELEVLALVAEGYTNTEIGGRLGISKKSVDTYRARVSQKLGLKNRAEIVRYALETGLLRSASGGGPG